MHKRITRYVRYVGGALPPLRLTRLSLAQESAAVYTAVGLTRASATNGAMRAARNSAPQGRPQISNLAHRQLKCLRSPALLRQIVTQNIGCSNHRKTCCTSLTTSPSLSGSTQSFFATQKAHTPRLSPQHLARKRALRLTADVDGRSRNTRAGRLSAGAKKSEKRQLDSTPRTEIIVRGDFLSTAPVTVSVMWLKLSSTITPPRVSPSSRSLPL